MCVDGSNRASSTSKTFSFGANRGKETTKHLLFAWIARTNVMCQSWTKTLILEEWLVQRLLFATTTVWVCLPPKLPNFGKYSSNQKVNPRNFGQNIEKKAKTHTQKNHLNCTREKSILIFREANQHLRLVVLLNFCLHHNFHPKVCVNLAANTKFIHMCH